MNLKAILAELQREISMRRQVYPGWVRAGKLKAETAQRRIELLEDAITLLLTAKNPPDLSGGVSIQSNQPPDPEQIELWSESDGN